MKRLYYIKEGRRYKPVAEYDSDLMDSFPKGDHLVSVYPGGSSRRFNIDPAYAPMIAAGRVAQEAISSAIYKASELRPKQTPITEAQREAWQRLAESFGEDILTLHGASVHECAEAGVKAMITEADKLLSNPTVRKAYERFLMVCELTKEQNNE